MRDFFCGSDHTLLIADVNRPDLHRHWAKHIVISLSGKIEVVADKNKISCIGIMINSNVVHTVRCTSQRHVVFSFEEVSGISAEIGKKYLFNKDYCLLDQTTVGQVKEIFALHDPLSNLKSYYQFYDSMLNLLGLPCGQDMPRDGRIIRAVDLIKRKKEIGYNVIGDILRATHISQSRLSHLFKEQAGMSLNSYLAMIKLEKAYQYLLDGNSVTDAALMAGFNSASHFASASKNMIGLSAGNMSRSGIFVTV